MSHHIDDIWHRQTAKLAQPTGSLGRSAGLLIPDLATERGRRRSPVPASIAEMRALRARETANRHIRTLEKRIEELEEAARRDSHGTTTCSALSGEVNLLIAGDFDSDETDEIIVAMHRKMAAGDLRLIYELACVVAGIHATDEIDARCLALETLSTARLASTEPLLPSLIVLCLTSDIERLQFRAIGASHALPPATRTELSHAIGEAVERSAPGSSTRRLGTLFLEQNG